MNVRNFLAPGDFVITVPAGFNVTLQYDENGVIQKLLTGLDPESGCELPDELLHAILPSGIIPNSIPVVQGTSWISGVFTHPGVLSNRSGLVPDDLIEDISVDLVDNPAAFTFYAASVRSNALQFAGGLASQKWLRSTGFEVLPNYVIPAGLTPAQWDNMITSGDLIWAGVLVMHQWKWAYVSFDLMQHTVSAVSKQFDTVGYLRGIVAFTDGDKLETDYFNVVKYNIQPNSIIIHDGSEIISIRSADNKSREPRSAKLSCPVCGSVIQVNTEMTMCSNQYCPSRYYEHTSHFLSVLGLPLLPRSRYNDAFKHTAEFRFSNLLDLVEYQNMSVSVTPYQLLRAAIPLTIVRFDKALEELCSRCNNSIQSILYHIKHVDRLEVDLDMPHESAIALLPLSQHPILVDDVDKLFHNPNIKVVSTNIKFDGPEIFRGSTIGITGTFRHGSHMEVSAILRSYGAQVVSDSSEVGCVIIGDMNENSNGTVIRTARCNHIPIFSESEFFARYEIDDDLQQGGLI